MEEQKIIIGTCESLEKSYFRLTIDPDPSKIRPKHILEKSLLFLKEKSEKINDYEYLCDQLKSIRQDMNIQNIFDEFSIKVYEFHSKLALKYKDLANFIICQEKLMELYFENKILSKNIDEFLSYQILYTGLFNYNIELQESLKLVLKYRKIKLPEMSDNLIKLSINLINLYRNYDFYKFLKLSRNLHNHGEFLIDLFLDKINLDLIISISKSLYFSLLIIIF